MGAVVKLTLTHDDFAPGSKVLNDVSRGWPGALSSLKVNQPPILDVAQFEWPCW